MKRGKFFCSTFNFHYFCFLMISVMIKIKNVFFRRFYEKVLAKKHSRVAASVQYKEKEEVKTCLLFYVAGEEVEEAIEALQQGMPKTKFQRLCFIPSEREVLDRLDVIYYRQNELGWKGVFANARLEEVLSKKFDLLIDLTTNSNVFTQYVLKNSNAQCIISKNEADGFADIVVNEMKDEREFVKKLMVLLAEISSYENGKI